MKLSKLALAMGLLVLSPVSYAAINGTVYEDLPMTAGALNTYGVKEANELGVAGVTVTVFGTGGGTTTTAADGTWSVPAATGNLRVEFSDWPTYLQESPDSGNGNTSAQFVSGGDVVNFGLHVPSDYSDQTNPPLMVAVFPNGDPLASPAGTSAAHLSIVQVDHDQTGDARPSSGTAATAISNAANVGTIWGLAWDNEAKDMYASAMVRRHAGLGSLGEGGIYVIDMSTGSPVVSNWLDVTTLGLSVGTVGAGATVELRNISRDLGADQTSPSTDAAGYPAVGRIGLGDIELSGNLRSLFVSNLSDQTVSEIQISDKSLLGTYSFPAGLCTNGSLRPFALKHYHGDLYAGAVCDAETGTNTDLSAHVFQLDVNTSTFTSVFSTPLDYNKDYSWSPAAGGNTCGASTGWYPWSGTVQAACNGSTNFTHPTPLLSDIEFDTDGSMMLSFADRFALQMGWENGSPTDVGANWRAVTGGDILRVYNNAGTYELESNGTAGPNTTAGAGSGFGPGGGEYYFDDTKGGAHLETTLGGLAFLRGSLETALTAMDPQGTEYNAGGVHKFDNETAVGIDGVYLYRGDNDNGGGWGKSAGLGDIEYSTAAAPIEIGNLVWNDADSDGIQDPDETGIASIDVDLVLSGSVIATATTDANGNYIFSNDPNGVSTASHIYNIASLTPSTNYIVRISNASGSANQAVLGTNEITVANVGEGSSTTLNDSNGTSSGVNADASVNGADIPRAGVNNHSYDFGFRAAPVGGSITIIKDATPNDPQDFAFTATGAGTSNFSLDDDADATLSNTQAFTGLADGNFSFTETAVTNWTLTGVSCTGSTNSTITKTAAGVDITLSSSEDVICTFYNNTHTCPAGEILNQTVVVANESETTYANNSDSACFEVTTPSPSVDLSLVKTASSAAAVSGDAITYTITVTNGGPGDATGVEVIDQLPAGVTYANNFTATQGAYVAGTGIWTVGALANGASATLTIDVTID